REPLERMVAEFSVRRDVIVSGLRAIDRVPCTMPADAFYALPNVTRIDQDSKRLADFLLEEGGVACLAGTAFGEHGRGYLRFSYANSVENIREGLRRLQDALKRYRTSVH